MPLTVKGLQSIHNLRAAGGIQRACRLVRQDDFPAVHQGAGNAHALLLPAGKLHRQAAQPVRQPQSAEQGGGPRQTGSLARAGVHSGQGDVLHRRAAAKQVVPLEHKAQMRAAQVREGIGIQSGGVLPVDAADARAGRIQTAQQVHKRGFAGTGGPHNGHKLAALNGKAHPVQHLYTILLCPVPFGHALHCNKRHQCGPPGPGPRRCSLASTCAWVSSPTITFAPFSRPERISTRTPSVSPVVTGRV